MIAIPETVFIIDNDNAVRAALRNLLESAGWAVRTFSSPAELLKMKEEWRARGCLILEVRLPGTSGLQFQQELAAAKIEMPIIFITGHADVMMSVQAMKAGAVDFLTKPVRDQDLLDAVSRAMNGLRKGIAENIEISGLRRRYDSLTPREKEVLELINGGLPNKQIASQLGMSETTVKIHRGNLTRKMQADSLPELIRLAARLNIPARKC